MVACSVAETIGFSRQGHHNSWTNSSSSHNRQYFLNRSKVKRSEQEDPSLIAHSHRDSTTTIYCRAVCLRTFQFSIDFLSIKHSNNRLLYQILFNSNNNNSINFWCNNNRAGALLRDWIDLVEIHWWETLRFWWAVCRCCSHKRRTVVTLPSRFRNYRHFFHYHHTQAATMVVYIICCSIKLFKINNF